VVEEVFVESAVATTGFVAPFEATVGPHYPALVRRLALILGDADSAEDMAQTAYLRAFEAWPDSHAVDPRAWLYTIGIRLALNELRRRRRVWSRSGDVSEATWAMRIDPDLWSALAELDPRHRAALVLTALDGYSQAEVGALLGVPAGTVGSWLSRAKSRLRERLREDI
jgi:RNA polymerase sigma-70 factor (ECF subfamily)